MMKQLPTESKKFDLKNWCIENKAYLLLIILIYQVAVLSIGIINFPYLDDNARQVAGMTDFGTTYARWGSEFLSWFVQGSGLDHTNSNRSYLISHKHTGNLYHQ